MSSHQTTTAAAPRYSIGLVPRAAARDGLRRWGSGGGTARAAARAASLAATIAVWLAAASVGCRPEVEPLNQPGGGDAPDTQWQNDLFVSAIDSLNRLEQLDSGAMFEEVMRRLSGGDVAAPSDPLLATWPEPEILSQVVDRLNGWLDAQPRPDSWQPDPMLSSLPEALRRLPVVENLGAARFSHVDGFALREASWLRDVAQSARGEQLDDLSRAVRLFDWVVCNIQLVPGEEPSQAADDSSGPGPSPKTVAEGGSGAASSGESPGQEPVESASAPTDGSMWQFPWETLWFGRGTVWQRAWVYVLLLRQQGIDAAILAVPQSDEPASALRPWAVGVLCEGKLRLFDPQFGLPIAGRRGPSLGPDGRLWVEPAALEEMIEEPALLDRLAAAPDRSYRVRAEDLRRVVALVEASPACLSWRMERLESRLSGEQRLVLSVQPSRLARRFGEQPGVRAVGLWTLPFETYRRRAALSAPEVQRRLVQLLPFLTPPAGPPLWKGRLLFLRGQLDGPDGAAAHLQRARLADAELVEAETWIARRYLETAQAAGETITDAHRQAAEQMAQIQATMLLRAKMNATYWLGLISLQAGRYEAAYDYFATRTLEIAPDGPWADGARYNLARSFEAAGQMDRAVLLLRTDSPSPDQEGCLVRARWLEEAARRADAARRHGREKQSPSSGTVDAAETPPIAPAPSLDMPTPAPPESPRRGQSETPPVAPQTPTPEPPTRWPAEPESPPTLPDSPPSPASE